MDEVSGVKEQRRFISSADLERGRVPATAWNSFAAIPGPSPEWFKSTTPWTSSSNIGITTLLQQLVLLLLQANIGIATLLQQLVLLLL